MNLAWKNGQLPLNETKFKHQYFILFYTCTLSKVLSWKVIISLSEGLKETGTQWLGGLGRTLGDGGSLNLAPA